MICKLVCNHIIDFFLAKFRDKDTSSYECGICVENVSFFLAGEISNYLQTDNRLITTPLGEKTCQVICEEVVLIPVLRAGVAMLSAFQRLLPQSSTGFIWIHRDVEAMPVIDKYKFPRNTKKEIVTHQAQLVQQIEKFLNDYVHCLAIK